MTTTIITECPRCEGLGITDSDYKCSACDGTGRGEAHSCDESLDLRRRLANAQQVALLLQCELDTQAATITRIAALFADLEARASSAAVSSTAPSPGRTPAGTADVRPGCNSFDDARIK